MTTLFTPITIIAFYPASEEKKKYCPVTCVVGYHWEVVTIILFPTLYFLLLYPLSQGNLFSIEQNSLITWFCISKADILAHAIELEYFLSQLFFSCPRRNKAFPEKGSWYSQIGELSGHTFMSSVQMGLLFLLTWFLPQSTAGRG